MPFFLTDKPAIKTKKAVPAGTAFHYVIITNLLRPTINR